VNAPRVLSGRHFMMGDVACAEGALAAGCTFFAGYPITPSTEVAERLALRLPQVGGHYIQMEDELASMAAIVGASWAGAKAMTATSGPGFSLMMENLGLAVMMEAPCVVVDVQRGSPSTGLPTLTGQGDVMQAKWGSHGDYEIIAYAPATCQEMFDLTVRAFNMAERFRNPVVILADEVVGHMTERVVIPPEEAIERWERPRPTVPPHELLFPFAADHDLVPPMPRAGEGYRIYVESLTHDERGYPVMHPDVHDRLVRRLNDKIRRAYHQIVDYELLDTEDAEVVVVAYGSTARSARHAVRQARREGMRVGLLRPITLWPFPAHVVEQLSSRVRAFVVAELNLGQVAREVERFTDRPVYGANHPGGAMMSPELILSCTEEAYRHAQGSRRRFAPVG